MSTTGRIVSFDEHHVVVLEVTLSDGTVLEPKACGCVMGDPTDAHDLLRRKIRNREMNSGAGQDLHRARLADKWPMRVFG